MKHRLFILLFLISSQTIWAAVDLVTLPRREKTQLTIYNSQDITMVKESRFLTVRKGLNQIQFSWANTLIDPTSIEFRILDHMDQVFLLETTYPRGRNDALQWNIQSELKGKIPVEIRYFTSGITWSADYRGISNSTEDQINLKGYVRVYNHSGETYENAEVRLVVGNINLVENIRDLATRPAPGKYQDYDYQEKAVIRQNFNRAMEVAEEEADIFMDDGVPTESALEEEKQIIKKGVSEYFIFTIDGQETIKINEPKRLVSLDVNQAQLETLYKLTDRLYPKSFQKFYRIRNETIKDDKGKEKELNPMNNLGLSPLPNGQVKLFTEYPNQDLAFKGSTTTKYVAIGEKIEVNVGFDHDITIKRVLKKKKTQNIRSRQYQRRLNRKSIWQYDLIDYDEVYEYETEIISGKDKKVSIEVERYFGNNILIWSQGDKPKGWDSNNSGTYLDLRQIEGQIEKSDQSYVKYFVDLKPGEKKTLRYIKTVKKRKVGPELNGQEIHRPTNRSTP